MVVRLAIVGFAVLLGAALLSWWQRRRRRQRGEAGGPGLWRVGFLTRRWWRQRALRPRGEWWAEFERDFWAHVEQTRATRRDVGADRRQKPPRRR